MPQLKAELSQPADARLLALLGSINQSDACFLLAAAHLAPPHIIDHLTSSLTCHLCRSRCHFAAHKLTCCQIPLTLLAAAQMLLQYVINQLTSSCRISCVDADARLSPTSSHVASTHCSRSVARCRFRSRLAAPQPCRSFVANPLLQTQTRSCPATAGRARTSNYVTRHKSCRTWQSPTATTALRAAATP